MKAIACNLYKLTLTGGVAITLTANSGQSSTHIGPTLLIEKDATVFSEGANVIAINQQSNFLNVGTSNNVMHTLCSDHHGTPHAVCYSVDALSSNSMKSKNPDILILNDQGGGVL